MKILISGAGIAGLSLALRLRQRGLVPLVIERSPRLRTGGYMLGLLDPGYDAAERMGLAGALRAAAYMPRRLIYVDRDGRERFALEGRSLAMLAGERQLNLMRGDIEKILYRQVCDEVEVRFGASVAEVEMRQDGVLARLDDKTAIEADLIVGADGLHSNVRALCFGKEDRFVHYLGSRVAAFILDRSAVPGLEPDTTYSLTEVGRAAALAAMGADQIVAFLIYRVERKESLGTVEAELRQAFAGAGWLVPAMLDHVAGADSVYFDEVSQVISPSLAQGRAALLGDAGYAVSLIAGKGASLAMAGAVVLADGLADQPADIAGALARYEARLRPMAEQAQAIARRNMNLFTPANQLQLHAREIALRLAAWPPIARIAKRLLNPSGERL